MARTRKKAPPPAAPSLPMIVHIRWAVRRDMPEVLEIEDLCFTSPWVEEDFVRCLRQRNCIGMVAECQERVVGFMVYELHKNRLHVLNFAVHPAHWRRSIGRQMIDKLVNKLGLGRRNRIMLEVREKNLDAQLFFSRLGFRAISLLRDFYEDTTEDAYLMQYRYAPGAAPASISGPAPPDELPADFFAEALPHDWQI